MERVVRTGSLLMMAAFAAPTLAAEGMWTLDNLPRDEMTSRYGFTPNDAWVDRVMKSSVRLAGGCSGSFVSEDGLVMTNHHCIVDCVAQLSSGESDLVKNGFIAAERSQERICPDVELNRLERIVDVSERIGEATTGLDGEAFADAKRAEQSKIESECVGSDSARVRCDVVDLYQGGVQHLYRYTRYSDVRLVFAPEFATAFFGGDPDNFNFPRFNLDFGLLRAYVDGKPAEVDNHFAFNADGAEAGELVMITGHPGSTQRLLTVAQLETLRDQTLVDRLFYLAEMRGLLTRYSAESAEAARQAQTDLFGVENGFKALRGRLQALLDPAVFEQKRTQEGGLREHLAKDAGMSARIGDPWAAIAKSQQTWRDIETAYNYLEGGRGFASEYFSLARTLLRGVEERAKQNDQRLAEYTDAGMTRLEQQLFSSAPIYPEYEKVKLGWSLAKLRENLGADHPVVRAVLGSESPQQLADRVIDGTRLGDVDARRELWKLDAEALAGSDDPMIALARRVDAASRQLRQRYEREVEAVADKNAELISQVRFDRHGTGTYPDATFSLRLSHGIVEGWQEKGEPVPPITTMQGLYARATGAEPYALAPSWIEHRDRLDLETPMNFVSSNDIIGGNSGSPVINRDAEVVGLVFDGNIHSLGGAFWYDGDSNRSVSVHSAAIIHALRQVYDAGHLADEMLGN